MVIIPIIGGVREWLGEGFWDAQRILNGSNCAIHVEYGAQSICHCVEVKDSAF